MPPRTITPEALRQDTTAVLAYLRALDAALPGHVEEGLLEFLESVAANDMTLSLFAAALGAAGKAVRP